MVDVQDLAQLLLCQTCVLAQIIQPFTHHTFAPPFHIKFMDPCVPLSLHNVIINLKMFRAEKVDQLIHNMLE